jgi:hypothetical protein
MNRRLYLLIHPEPEVGRIDTSLRYTDILFGFVIKELFVRLQNWSLIGSQVRLQLVVGTVLVLCSWIGFRRSLNRPLYEVKFFNLPLMMFVTDQLMLILYFRIAVMTTLDGTVSASDVDPTARTLQLLFWVFVLYGIWDFFAIWMAYSKRWTGSISEPRYFAIEGGAISKKSSIPNWPGFIITFAGGVLLYILLKLSCALTWDVQMIGSVVVLLAYRFVKEIRTSWRNL